MVSIWEINRVYAKATGSQTTNMYKHKKGCLTNLHFPVSAIDTPKIQSVLGAPSLLGFQSPPGFTFSLNLHLPQPILGGWELHPDMFFFRYLEVKQAHINNKSTCESGRKIPNRMERCCWTRRPKNLSNRCQPPWWKVGEVIAHILSLHLVVQIPGGNFNQNSEFGIMKNCRGGCVHPFFKNAVWHAKHPKNIIEASRGGSPSLVCSLMLEITQDQPHKFRQFLMLDILVPSYLYTIIHQYDVYILFLSGFNPGSTPSPGSCMLDTSSIRRP